MKHGVCVAGSFSSCVAPISSRLYVACKNSIVGYFVVGAKMDFSAHIQMFSFLLLNILYVQYTVHTTQYKCSSVFLENNFIIL